VENGTEVKTEELLDFLAADAKTALINYADRLARVAVQTGLCCALITSESAYGSDVVYLWDAHPRRSQHFVAEVTRLLHIPYFFSKLVGAPPSTEDLAYINDARSSPATALEDSVKRRMPETVAAIVVDAARIGLQRTGEEKKQSKMVRAVIARTSALVCAALGSAVGQLIGGARGEYYGESVAQAFAPAITTVISLHTLKMQSEKRRKHRRHHGDAVGTSTSAVEPTAEPNATK